MRFLSVVVCLYLTVIPTAYGNLLTNGGMEKDGSTPINQYNLVYVSPTVNTAALPGWTITSGTIDICPSSYFQTSQGSYCVDMVGTPGIGSIFQTVATVAATDYTLTFDLAGNPELGPINETGTTKVLRIEAFAANGITLLATQDYQITKGTRTNLNMQWLSNSFNFTATGATSTVRISALTPLNLPLGTSAATVQTGPVIDNLNLDIGSGVPVPEPASLGVLGIGALMLLRRRPQVVPAR